MGSGKTIFIICSVCRVTDRKWPFVWGKMQSEKMSAYFSLCILNERWSRKYNVESKNKRQGERERLHKTQKNKEGGFGFVSKKKGKRKGTKEKGVETVSNRKKEKKEKEQTKMNVTQKKRIPTSTREQPPAKPQLKNEGN